MPVFKPFKATHPNEKNVKSFPTKSVDNLSDEQIQKKINGIEDSILQIIAPTFSNEGTSKEKYQEVRKNFEEAIEKEKLLQDPEIAFYIYQQKSGNHHIQGLIGLYDLKSIDEKTLRLHENTLEEREKRFADYLSEVHIQSEPILITYPYNPKLEVLMNREMNGKMLLSYTDENDVQHNVWKIDNRLNLTNYMDAFKNMEAVYLADGHHRLGSSKRYAELQKKLNKEHLGNEPYNYVLVFALDSNALKIYEYNRLIKDLNGLSKEDFLKKIAENYTIVPKGNTPYFPSQKFHISMYLEGEYYGLYIHHDLRGKPPGLGDLDTYLFDQYIAQPILNIKDSSNEDRIEFIRGTNNSEGIKEMQKKVDSGEFKVGFGFYPVKFPDLKLIADLDLKMPPKSTYIYPKVLTGLLMYNMKK